MAENSNDGLERSKGPENNLDPNRILERVAPHRRSFVQKLLGIASFAVPSIRTFIMTSAATPNFADAATASNQSCPVGIDISTALTNPSFTGSPVGSPPIGWSISGSPAPGFETYAPTTAQYPAGTSFTEVAHSPTGISGSGIIRQISSLTWAGGNTYVLKLWCGLPEKEPNGTTPVIGWPQAPNGAARLYLTMGNNFDQVAAFDIPSPPAGQFYSFVASLTLPTNSPAIGKTLGVMIFVSAPYNVAADFVIGSCSTPVG